ncbi:hypothetical protein MBAV_001293 [Candidatus Magnetobacterium bavaricum]|uniref:Uncharacterized protein n=1 Tax=Candidatus Magnetobacterium bavaricum TaxID=29290 RepID=A0A0F3H0Q6_9BACT|nr:hypothetical protein MBAV_001293 [Candidatus Magnetobacterium bavaricum]
MLSETKIDGNIGSKIDSIGASFKAITSRLDEIETFIAKTNDASRQKTDASLKELAQLLRTPADTSMTQKFEAILSEIAKEIALLRDKPPVVQGVDSKIDSDIGNKIDGKIDTIGVSFKAITSRLDEIETFIAKTNDASRQKTDAGLKELTQLLRTSAADTSIIQKVEAILSEIAKEIALLKDKPSVVQGADSKIYGKIDGIGASFKTLTGRLDEIETFIAKTNDVARQKTDAGLKELAQLLQTTPEWILAYTSTVQKLEAGLRDIAGEVRQLKDRPSVVQGTDGNIDSMRASFKAISGRLDEIETFIAKTNSILKKHTQEGLTGLSTTLGSSLNTSMSTMLAAVQGRLQELEVAIETIAGDLTQLRDKPPVMWPDNMKGSFDVISNRLDEIEAFIADANNTMRQRSEERLLEFTQTIQSSIDTSVSEKMAVGIRNLNDELVSLRERLSDMPLDKVVRETRSSLDKFQGSLTEKLEVAISGLYDELTLVKGKLPDMAIVSELGMKLEQLSQQSSKVFSSTVDAVSEKTAGLSHDLGASLQTIAGTIDGIEDIIRNVSYNLSDDDNTGSVKAQIMAIRETMSDIIRFLLLVSDDDNTGSVKAQIMAIRETMSDIIRFLLLLSQR